MTKPKSSPSSIVVPSIFVNGAQSFKAICVPGAVATVISPVTKIQASL